MKKIALTGAHGTGKTTLTSRLPETLKELGRVNVCREAPRLIINAVEDSEYFRRVNNTPSRQAIIFLEHLMEERRQEAGCDILVTDRTLIDHLAYTSALFPDFTNTTEFNIYQKLSIESLSFYDRIFKLPIEFSVVDDGVREGEAEFQRQIDFTIDSFYKKARVSPIVVKGSVEDRLTLIREQLV